MSNILGQVGEKGMTAGSKEDSLSNTLSSMLLNGPSSSKGSEAQVVKNSFEAEDIHKFYNSGMGQNVLHTT